MKKSSLFLDALHCRNRGRPPVWLMRQAGRYLPEYRKLREKYSLRELFLTPELAAQVTKMPIEILGVDAAILFSDITVVVLALGLQLDFKEGPQIAGTIGRRDVEVLRPIAEAIRLVKGDVPLIGFCGGPFTVASYVIEKEHASDLPMTKKFMVREPEKFEALLETICGVTVEYLQMQEEAGVDAVQIFDSWAHVLTREDWLRFCAPYLQKLIEAVKVPVIVFMRGASTRAEELAMLQPRGISFDWQRPMQELRRSVPKEMAMQGNLDPDLLYAPLPMIRRKTEELLESMRGDGGFIVNLGHGVKPDMPVDAVRALVETVKGFS
ncbi:MAG TPA: uroporphyrinogen decarboxylase [Chlamydiales bacterium]|nr:uroporphyrinogen decarboxylase [Chlamydiales bacterium]